MTQKITINVPLNRVEGDLEIRAEIDGGYVSNAWSSGTMYRGFEQILCGRGALDGLVITPRVCGICGTSHLTAASGALEMIAGILPPPNAVRIRNVALMAEHIQNDIRQTFLMFTPDFTNQVYRKHALFEHAVQRYEAFKGETVFEVIRSTKKILEMIAIVGGQWPHSSYMVPGGIVSIPGKGDLLQCRLILKEFRRWYEQRILGCSLERWAAIQSKTDLDNWLDEREAHRESDVGFFIRFARQIELDTIGRGHNNYLTYGAFDIPEGSQVRSLDTTPEQHQQSTAYFLPAGFVRHTEISPFDQEHVAEHVAHSWFIDYEGGKHPFDGETCPYASGQESKKYSWAKAPRYKDLPAETGALAQMIVAGHPLFKSLVQPDGPSVFVRQLARIVKPVQLIPAMDTWLQEAIQEGDFYLSPGEIVDGEGFGLTEGPRGALGHWMHVKDGTIARYQIITPTAWNASPRDSDGVRGPWEEALVGTAIQDINNPVELGHVVRSFDACLVCTVHLLNTKQRSNSIILNV